jgi:5-methylcytosine-specific restriction endonuclease McrA
VIRDPRDSRRWRRLRLQVLRGATHCAICHRPLDFNARPCSRWAPSVDHIIPIALGGAPYERSNCREVHFGCNARRGVGRGRIVRLVQQQEPLMTADWW